MKKPSELISVMVCCLALASLASSGFIKGPKYTVAFLEMYEDLANYNQTQWDAELDAMLAVGIRKVVLSYVLNAYYPNYTFSTQMAEDNGNCLTGPLWKKCNELPHIGCYGAFYPVNLGPCVYNANPRANSLQLFTNSIVQRKMEVWFGIALPQGMYVVGDPVRLKALVNLQFSVMSDLYKMFGNLVQLKIWKGFYSVIEVSNTPLWASNIEALAKGYLEPISAYAKSLNPDLKMFGSPYFRTADANHISADKWKDFWVQVFRMAPSFDFIAQQDGAGGGNYSVDQLMPYLKATVDASRESNRTVWTNIEIWRHFLPVSASCDSRRPAATTLDIEILAAEAPLVEEVIFWEWHSYLSPFAFCPWKAQSIANYANYLAYVTNVTEN